jgi:hypothetical protein
MSTCARRAGPADRTPPDPSSARWSPDYAGVQFAELGLLTQVETALNWFEIA